jgi:hypothetical protein
VNNVYCFAKEVDIIFDSVYIHPENSNGTNFGAPYGHFDKSYLFSDVQIWKSEIKSRLKEQEKQNEQGAKKWR